MTRRIGMSPRSTGSNPNQFLPVALAKQPEVEESSRSTHEWSELQRWPPTLVALVLCSEPWYMLWVCCYFIMVHPSYLSATLTGMKWVEMARSTKNCVSFLHKSRCGKNISVVNLSVKGSFWFSSWGQNKWETPISSWLTEEHWVKGLNCLLSCLILLWFQAKRMSTTYKICNLICQHSLHSRGKTYRLWSALI